MADYFEQQHSRTPSEHLDSAPTTFIRPLNLSDPHRRRSAATSRLSHTSHGSILTYVTNPPSVPGETQVPVEPILGMPTPVIPGQPTLLPEEDDPLNNADYTIVDPDPDYDETEDNGGFKMQGGKRGFVGGFVSGLKRLPRAMLRNPRGVDGIDRKEQVRRGTVAEGTGPETELPSYQPYADPPFLNVEAFERLAMPTQHTISVTSPSARDSRDPEQTLAEISDKHQSHPNIHDGETTLVHQCNIGISSPVEVEPLPTSDYDKMSKMSSALEATPSVSVASHINRLQKFVHDIHDLPWVSSRVAADYVPEKNGRRGHGKLKIPKTSEPWYRMDGDETDFVSERTPWESHSAPAMSHHREEGPSRVMTEYTSPSTAPISSVTGSPSTMSPRFSVTSEPGPGGRNLRHVRTGRHHSRHHRHQSRAQPTMYPYIAAPQPLYVYPGPPTPPILQPPGFVSGSPRHNRATTSPGVPVYMIPLPPPVYQPMPSFHYPISQHQSPNLPVGP